MNKQKSLDSIAAPPSPHPNPEVVPQARCRRFTAEYKLRILTEADQAKGADGQYLHWGAPRGEGRKWVQSTATEWT